MIEHHLEFNCSKNQVFHDKNPKMVVATKTHRNVVLHKSISYSAIKYYV